MYLHDPWQMYSSIKAKKKPNNTVDIVNMTVKLTVLNVLC